MLDYRYLKAFILTAKHSSFSKAAYELKIAQSAVSRQIKLLEKSIGHELIIRSPQKVILTEKGQDLLLAAQGFENHATEIFEEKRTKPIRIGVLQGLLEAWSREVFERYYEQHDGNMVIKVASPPKLRTWLENGKLDVAFINENIQNEIITSTKLFDETIVLISKDSINLDNIHQYRWIIYGNDDYIMKIYKKRSKKIVRVNDVTTVVQLVRAGVGIAAIPDHIVGDPGTMFVKRLDDIKSSEIYLSTLKFKTPPPRLTSFINIVMERKQHLIERIPQSHFSLAIS